MAKNNKNVILSTFLSGLLTIVMNCAASYASDFMQDTLSVAGSFKIHDITQIFDESYRGGGIVRSRTGYYYRLGPEVDVPSWFVSGTKDDMGFWSHVVHLEEDDAKIRGQ